MKSDPVSSRLPWRTRWTDEGRGGNDESASQEASEMANEKQRKRHGLACPGEGMTSPHTLIWTVRSRNARN